MRVSFFAKIKFTIGLALSAFAIAMVHDGNNFLQVLSWLR